MRDLTSRPRTRPTAAVLAALLAVVLAACGGGDPADRELSGVVRDPAPTVEVAGTTDAAGSPVALDAPAPDGIEVVYFGYTNCPDICPTTMADLRAALGSLDDDEVSRVGVAFVTVDPGRDSPQVVTDYARSFVADANGVSIADDAALRQLATQFGVDYSVQQAADGTIEVGHTTSLFALDAEHHLLVSWPFGTSQEDLARDLETLLARQA